MNNWFNRFNTSNAMLMKRRLLPMVLAVIASVLLVAGCAPLQKADKSGPASQTSQGDSGAKIAPSLDALFAQELSNDKLSSFEREVLERAKKNGKISAADYENAKQQEYSCMAQAGWTHTFKKLPNGLYQTTGVTPQPKTDEDADRYKADGERCSEGVSMAIESLYGIQQGNPDLLEDPHESAVACLKKNKLVDANYTGKKLQEQLGELNNVQSRVPFDMHNDEVQLCLYSAGFALDAGDGE